MAETETVPLVSMATIAPRSVEGDVMDATFRLSMTTEDGISVEFDLSLISLTLFEMTAQNALRAAATIAKVQHPEAFKNTRLFGGES
jgi:hypothetical protein